MITIDTISVGYGEKLILENLSLLLEENRIYGLVGLNGSGKTTLLNTMYGIKKPMEGRIELDNAPLKRKDIGYLETENFFYPGITGYEYLSLFYKTKDREFAESLNDLFKLPLHNLIDGYSTGMKKKLAIMAVLLQDKKILILDEPFNGLDIESSKILSLIITRQKEMGRTILLTSHIMESLTDICDAIHYLKEKRIFLSKEKQEFDSLNRLINEEIGEKYNVTIDKLFG